MNGNKEYYPRISHLLVDLASQGVRLSDKAMQALNYAAVDAEQQGYPTLYDDNILAGVVRCCGTISGFLESFGLDPIEVIDAAHEPLEYFPWRDYRHWKATTPQKRLKPRRKRQLQATIKAKKPSDGFFANAKFGTNQASGVSSEDLFSAALEMPAVWEALKNCGLSINKVKMHGRKLRIIEPDIEAQKFLISFERNKYRFDFFDFTSGARLVPESTGDGKIFLCRIEIVTPRTHDLADQVAEFEWLINKVDVAEFDIQKFLEKHPNFLLGIEHKNVHSQLTLVRDDRPDLRPDFFLERLEGQWCDILDLKLPSERLVVGSSNRRTFSAGIISALGQLREYQNYFDDAENRRKFTAAHGLHAYKPKIQVLIGRSSSFRTFEERRALEEQFSQLNILTFDDILLRVKQQLTLLR